jgi:hypothetical protein
MLNAILFSAELTSSILALTSFPKVNSSSGLSILLLLIFDICTRPSTPGSNSINAPKLANLTTFPNTIFPIGYFSSTLFQGSSINFFMLKASFLFSLSISKIYTFILSPTFNASSGLSTLPQDISETCNNPSTPLISTKAPKFVNLFTSPSTIVSFSKEAQVSSICSSLIVFNISLLEPTILVLYLSFINSIILTSNSDPLYFSKLST